MSEANRMLIRYIKEVTYGVTPVNGTWQDLRYTSHTLSAAPQTVVSNEVKSNRLVADLNQVGREVGGDIGFELSAATYDDFLESLMGAAWAVNVLKAGTVQDSYSLEVEMPDWAATHYLQFKGMRIGTMSLNVAYGEIITGTFGFVGKEALESAVTLVGTGTTTAQNSNEIINGSGDVTILQIDAGSPGSTVKSISLNVDNNMRPIEGLTTVGPTNQAYGRNRITGTLEMYFDDNAMYAKLLANTAAQLDFTVSDGAKSYQFDMPKIKFSSGTAANQGVDTDIMLPLDYEIIEDTGSSSNITITRVP